MTNAAPPVAFEYFPTNGVRLHAAVAGPENGPLVILLHGFPEFWYGMRRQIGPLAQAGYRVLAPDQRGYNKSDKPPRVADYNLDHLAGDVIGLIDDAGREQAVVIGHDWGAVAAWWTAVRFPHRLQGIGILNVPHPVAMQRALRRSFSQLRKSWYVFVLQLPKIPEWTLPLRNWKGMIDTFKSSSRPGTFSEEDFAQYRQAWSQPGAIGSMVNWYRAALRCAPPTPANVRISVPTRILWGTNDKFVGRDLAEASLALCDHGELEYFEGATHWIAHEEPQRVNARLLEFCRRVSPVGK